jgi:hypothetical protein
MPVPVAWRHTAGVIAALEAEGLTVGDATAEDLEAPYVVVYRLNGTRDGEADAPDDRGEFIYQLTCVGRLASEAERLAELSESALRAMTVAGRAVKVWVEADGAVSRDDDVVPAVFYATPRFRIWTTPA